MAAPQPALFGRDAQREVIADCVASAAAGQACAVLCTGEAGIGKTRLAQEVDASARSRDFAVAWGVADDAAGTPPYWPWQQIFRSLATSARLADVVDENGAARSVGPLLASPATAGVDAQPRVTSPEDRFSLFDAATAVLRATACRQPLALIFDDAHWADEASRLLLRHLVRSLGDDRMLVWVNTRRLDGAGTGSVEHWSRVPGARRLDLTGLDGTAIRQQLESLLGADVTDSEVAGVESLTGGNPFFVVEAARALADRRAGRRAQATSVGTRQAVAARVGQLPPRTQAAVRAAAIIGREFDLGVLGAILDESELDCLEDMAAAEREAVVEPAPARRSVYRFSHAIIRDAIEDGLNPAERVDLHRRAGAALERLGGDQTGTRVFEIARHLAEAAPGGGRATAASWLERAADVALDELAYEDASRLYDEALSVGAGELEPGARCRLLLAAARAANRSGALGDCHARRTAAVEAAPADARLGVLAEAALAMDPVGVPGFDLATRRMCQQVLEQLDADATPLRARLTARFAETFVYLPDAEAANEASALAMRVAAEAGDDDALVASLRARQVVVAHPDRLDERGDVARRMLSLALARRDLNLELRARLCLVDVLFERGELAPITAELDACATCADELHSPFGRFVVLNTRAVQAQGQGRLAEARRLSDASIAAGGWGDHPDPPNRRAAVLSGIARHAGPDATILGALSPPEHGQKPPFIADVAAANALVQAGDRAGALAIWNAVGPPSSWRPPAHVVLIGAALGLETAMALDRPDDVEGAARWLEPYRGHHVVCGYGAASYLGPVELWLGKAAAHLGRLDDAVRDLQAATDLCRRAGAACYEVEARYELASVLERRRAQGDADAARGLAADCARGVEELGMAAFVERVANLRQRLRGRDAVPLTRREREVAALVADGLSNREIAARLVVSERTAENHVQHIFTKLGLRNRAELVRWFTTATRK